MTARGTDTRVDRCLQMMEWEEEGKNSCLDVCSSECESREERICDKMTGQDHLMKLMIDWGYEAILPQNRPPVFTISHLAHFLIGIIICAAGTV